MGGGFGRAFYFPPYGFVFIASLFLIFIFIIFKMSDSKFRLRDFVNVGGMIIGIALTAIGAIFVLNSALKVYVFGFDTPPYFSATEQCQYDHQKPMNGVDGPVKLEGEEYDECVIEKTASESARYIRQRKENMIDGLAMLLVGIPFWLLFGMRRKKRD